MKDLKVGIKGHEEMVVKKENTAEKFGNKGVDVLSSPDMIGFMEVTCRKSLQDYYENGETTVGIAFDIKHLASAGLGSVIKYDSELVEIHNKRLVFKVKAYTDEKTIGAGIHQRYIKDPKTINK